MKRIVASLAAYSLFCPLGVDSAVAADPSTRKLPDDRAPPTWTGFHAGFQGGHSWASDTRAEVSATPLPLPLLYVPPNVVSGADSFALDATQRIARSAASGFIGGGQIGYDWAFGERFLVGVEADFQGVIGGHGDSASRSSSTIFVATDRLDYLGTVRGRAGWLATPALLVYGTAGAAYGGPSSTTQIFQPGAGVVGGYGFNSAASTRFGWTAGAGVEWMLAPKWSVKAEYLHYDLGSVGGHTLLGVGGAMEFPFGDPLVDPIIPYTYLAAKTDTRFSGHVLRAGVNHHFDWSPSSFLFAMNALGGDGTRDASISAAPDADKPASVGVAASKQEKKSYYAPTRAYRLEPRPDIPSYVRNLGKTYEQFAGIDWLDIGLDTRVRFEYRKNDYRPWTDIWGADRPTQRRRPLPDSVWLLRTRAYLGVHDVLDPLRFAVEIQDSRALDSLYRLQGQDIDTADLIGGYGELYFKDIFAKDHRGNDRPVILRAGRFNLELLDKRLIAANEFRNTANTFDGFRVKIGERDNDWDIDSFLMRPVNRDPYGFDRPDWQNWIYGGVVSIRRWSEYATIQPYFLGRKQYADPASTSNSLRVHRETRAPGLRIYGALGDFDFDIDVNKQFGEVGEFQPFDNRANVLQATVQQDALGYTIEAGYKLPDHPWKPRFSASYAYATGDKRPFDSASQTFDSFYGFSQPLSRDGYMTWSNVRAPKLRLEFSPSKNFQIDSAFSAYWLASGAAAWSSANLSAPLGNRGTFIGTEVDVRLRYKLSRFVNLSASYARFWPGSFTTSFAPPIELQPYYPQTFPGQTGTTSGITARPTDFFYLEMTANAFGDGQPITGDPARDFVGLWPASDARPKAPPPSWRDIYVGVNMGAAWATPRSTVSTAPISSAPPSAPVAAASAMAPADMNLDGFIGGIQIGGNYKLNESFVAGLELDLHGVSDNADSREQLAVSSSIGNTFLSFGQRSVKLDYLGTIRPRLGYLLTPGVQLYATGGLAFAGVTSSAALFTERVGGITTTLGNPLYQDTRLGWTAGGGVEWAFDPNWSAKAEYLHYDLGAIRVETAVAHPSAFYRFGALGETLFDGNVIQAGLNRHFDWPGKY